MSCIQQGFPPTVCNCVLVCAKQSTRSSQATLAKTLRMYCIVKKKCKYNLINMLVYFAILVFWVKLLNLGNALMHTIPDNVQKKAAGQFSKECCNGNNEARRLCSRIPHPLKSAQIIPQRIEDGIYTVAPAMSVDCLHEQKWLQMARSAVIQNKQRWKQVCWSRIFSRMVLRKQD